MNPEQTPEEQRTFEERVVDRMVRESSSSTSASNADGSITADDILTGVRASQQEALNTLTRANVSLEDELEVRNTLARASVSLEEEPPLDSMYTLTPQPQEVAQEQELDMTEARSRQSDLVDSAIFEEPITVIGAGAIGSFVVLTLAKMGFKRISVYDNDTVGVENISNQFYPYDSVGTSKAYALANMIRDFERLSINVRNFLWTAEHRLSGYVIMAVDTMAVRNQIYRAVKRNSDVYGFIDGRMGGQQGEVYTVDLLDTEQKKVYEKYLWSDTEASELPCTQKAVMYNVLWIASMISNNLRLMLESKPFPKVMHMDFENVNHMNVTHE